MITTISDLLTADGQFYDKNLIHGKRGQTNPNPSFYRYHWPHMPSPSPAERNIWYQSISKHLPMEYATYRVQTSVGIEWKEDASIYAKWLFSATTGLIYQRIASKSWTTWTKDRAPRRRHTRSVHNIFKIEGTVDELPNDTKIVGINRIQPDRISPQFLNDRAWHTLAPPTTNSMGPDIRRADHALIEQKYRTYLYQIVMGYGSVFTDGSYCKGRATYGVVIQPRKFSVPQEHIDLAELVWDTGTVNGHPSYDLHSYRAELAGILCALKITIDLCNQAKINQGTCTLYCDNKGALLAAFGGKRPTPRWDSYDLLRINECGIINKEE